MNKKKIGIIAGIIFVLLTIYLAFNPAWITHPRYMLDKQYCEQDNDCILIHKGCDSVNRYNEKSIFESSIQTTEELCLNCGTKCIQNQCILIKCGDKNE